MLIQGGLTQETAVQKAPRLREDALVVLRAVSIVLQELLIENLVCNSAAVREDFKVPSPKFVSENEQ